MSRRKVLSIEEQALARGQTNKTPLIQPRGKKKSLCILRKTTTKKKEKKREKLEVRREGE